MIKIILLVAFIVLILLTLQRKSNSNLYKKAIFLVLLLGVLFIVITSGKYILPQALQIIKIGLPFLTKVIGI